MPAKACLSDIKAFSDQLQKDGYWVGGSDYGYGFPRDGYGYGYAMGGYPPGSSERYQSARSGYEIRKSHCFSQYTRPAGPTADLRGGARGDPR